MDIRQEALGTPGHHEMIRALILRMARENRSLGYCRIQGESKNLGHRVAKDCFTVEAWTGRGLSSLYLLFFLDHKTRRVHIAGMTGNPNDRFMVESARESSSFLQGKRFLICDRGTMFSQRFRAALPAGVRIVQTPFQSPSASAYADRFVQSIKEECQSRMIMFGERQVRKSLFEFRDHYHMERNHQGLGNELIEQPPTRRSGEEVVCFERLGGLLRHYERAAA